MGRQGSRPVYSMAIHHSALAVCVYQRWCFSADMPSCLLLYRWVFFQGNFASRQFFSRFSDIQGAKFANFCRTMVCFCNISVKFPISQNFRRKPTYNHYDHLTYCSMVLPLNWVHLISLSVTMNAIMQNAHMSVARNFTKWQIADCAFYVSFILQIVVLVMMDMLSSYHSMLYCSSPAAY